MTFTLDQFQSLFSDLRNGIGRVVKGQDEIVDLLLTSLFSRGHCLLEGPPGTAKTLLAQTLSITTSMQFGRVQFTPDLLPGDVLGVNIFDFQSNDFHLTKGPIFTDILLADEINRAPPKTQSALLQAMNERQVTIDGKTHDLGGGFFVIATQNPIEQHGTYPLPEAQLDRFMFKLLMEFPDAETELEILSQEADRSLLSISNLGDVAAVLDRDTLDQAHALVDGIRVDDSILKYIVDLVRATRSDTDLLFGASTRAASSLASAVRAFAAMDGRDYAIPDDVQHLFKPAMRHRIILGPSAEIEGRSPDEVLNTILSRQDAPR